jgi:putative iron-regulated protein
VAAADAPLAERIDALLAVAKARIAALGDPWDQVLAAPAGSPERLAAEAAVVALADLAAGLRDAGAELGVLVVIPAS